MDLEVSGVLLLTVGSAIPRATSVRCLVARSPSVYFWEARLDVLAKMFISQRADAPAPRLHNVNRYAGDAPCFERVGALSGDRTVWGWDGRFPDGSSDRAVVVRLDYSITAVSVVPGAFVVMAGVDLKSNDLDAALEIGVCVGAAGDYAIIEDPPAVNRKRALISSWGDARDRRRAGLPGRGTTPEGKIWGRLPRTAFAEVLLLLDTDERAVQVKKGAIVASPRLVDAISWDAASVPFEIRGNGHALVRMTRELDEVLATVGPRRLVLGKNLRMPRLDSGLTIHSG